MGGYFCVLLLSLPNVYPILKQAKPKLTTAIKSTILIGLALLPYGFPSGIYVIRGHRSSFYFGRCKTSDTGTLQPAVGGLTAYCYMAAPIFQLYQFLVLYAICKISLYQKLLRLLQQRSFFDVPRNHQIIFIFPFFV